MRGLKSPAALHPMPPTLLLPNLPYKLCPFVFFLDITMSEFLKNCIILVEPFLLAGLDQ
jgi:hypothetical protein